LPDSGVQKPSDVELMSAIARQDRSALAELWKRHGGLVFSLALKVVQNRQTAEDLLIDVFFELWQRAERYDPARGSPVTYIATLARSRSIDRRRSMGNRVTTSLDLAGPATFIASDNIKSSPHQHAAQEEEAVKVRKAVESLQVEQRQAIELAYYRGMSHSEIAAALQKPLGTVKTHIRQGCIRLRQLLRSSHLSDDTPG
jgi:RNA polymerase sigma-70 factor, ECF subfamily